MFFRAKLNISWYVRKCLLYVFEVSDIIKDLGLCQIGRIMIATYFLLLQIIRIYCTVWKLASVTEGIKSKNFETNIPILKHGVPIARYDIYQSFDTRSSNFSFLALNTKA